MTSPNQADFEPAVRAGAWWSGDSRKAANGRASDVILEKLGKKEPPDLSGIEAVQMGKVMEPTIARLFQEKHRIELKDADYALSHKDEPWLRSHFDYISADGRTLVECKNYNAGVMSKFDEDANLVPAADLAQLIHEAAVHNVEQIYLAVLFGGQAFRTYHFTITEGMKEDLIKQMAKYWGYVATQTMPEPDSLESCKIIYPNDNAESITATQTVERAIAVLNEYKQKIKHLENESESIELAIRSFMGMNANLITLDGKTLATWKSAKSSMKFDAKLFQLAMPEVYEKFVVETPGSRRFLLK
ncbi:COG5377 Phage-related protein, predicted endonuclease [uncultured Caudovirales phage]|uniref:COG5377 Phage-related protein, predicted endonuclease n=1 Tax=uncultured Caudovirales phage TaxID=2100421 RepID=A0A6J5M5C0_9CAUD|nr:COG5377 Phage-related protein, predicted endonuclease [uncultured Caudovirales phage]CAB4157962.1 COG5377 Phage-related protein, predicted endonuclease [uncultured Caudovirales phage]